MATLIKSLYPVSSTVAMVLTAAALASDTTLIAGRASTAVDNTTNLDIDHMVSGSVTAGTSPTASTTIEIWAWAAQSIASGVPTYPDSITGTDAAKTITSVNVKFGFLRLVASLTVDNVTGRVYPFAPVSIAQLFGSMPPFWGLFLVHSTGAALGGGGFQYERIQGQLV
jgi:hypothetical protein